MRDGEIRIWEERRAKSEIAQGKNVSEMAHQKVHSDQKRREKK